MSTPPVLTLSLSIDPPVHLTAGCTNGMVLDFHWESLTTDAVGEIPEPVLTPLWPHADSIPVHHIVWQTKVRYTSGAPSGRPRYPALVVHRLADQGTLH